MPKKTFTVLALLLLGLCGCIQPEVEQPGFMLGSEEDPLDFTAVDDTTIPPNPAPIPGNCDAMESQFDKDTCIFSSALEESNTEHCANISLLWQRNNCVTAIAQQKLDTSICNQMQSAISEDNTNVINMCIADVAFEVLYTAECKQFLGEEWESKCWGKVLQICGEIASQPWREVCIKKSAIESGDYKKCLPLHGFEKDTCLEEIAVSYGNTELCNPIEDEIIKESCLERASQSHFT